MEQHCDSFSNNANMLTTILHDNIASCLMQKTDDVKSTTDECEKVDAVDQVTYNTIIKSRIGFDTNNQIKNYDSPLKRVTFSKAETITYQKSNSLESNNGDHDVDQETKADLDEVKASVMCTIATEDILTKSELTRSASEESILEAETKTNISMCNKSDLYTTACEEAVNISSINNKTKNSDKSELYDTVSEELKSNSISQSDETDEKPQSHNQDANITVWESDCIDSSITKSEESTSSIKKDSHELNNSISSVEDFSMTGYASTSSFNEPETFLSSDENHLSSDPNNATYNIYNPVSSKPSKIISAINKNLAKLENHSNNLREVLSPVVKVNAKKPIASETQSSKAKITPCEIYNSTNIVGGILPSVEDFNYDNVGLTRKSSIQINRHLKEEKYLSRLKSAVPEDLLLEDSKHATSGSSHSAESSVLDQPLQSTRPHVRKPRIWSSVANALKNAVSGLSTSPSEKRRRKNEDIKPNCFNTQSPSKASSDTSVDDDDDGPIKKRMKYFHIQCRPTIRSIRPSYELSRGRKSKVKMCDKSTQTDFFLMN